MKKSLTSRFGSGNLKFKCAFGHEFEASPRLVLEGATGVLAASGKAGIIPVEQKPIRFSRRSGIRFMIRVNRRGDKKKSLLNWMFNHL